MKISEYIEKNLLSRPKKENKEWLANELNVNYKTLCGWFKRNSFDALILTKMLNILDIDFDDFSNNVIPLTKKEILSVFDEIYKEKPFVLEGRFINSNDKYIFYFNSLEIGQVIKINEEDSIQLSKADILGLIKGYEISRFFETNEFVIYIKEYGIGNIRKIIEDSDEINLYSNFKVTEITNSNIKKALKYVYEGNYAYIGELNDTKEIILEYENTDKYNKKTLSINSK